MTLQTALAAALVLAAVHAAPLVHSAPPAKKKLLVVTHTTGFRNSSIGKPGATDGVAQKTLAEIGERSGVYEVDYCANADDVKTKLSAEGLKKYDGVFFANTTGNLGIPDLKTFLDWIKEGHAFLGAHAASDTYHPRDAGGDTGYVEMLGAEFKTHGQQCEVDAIVERKNHPAVAHLTSPWKVKDEIYEFVTNNRNTVRVLLTMDKHPNDGHPEAGQSGDYLLSWTKPYGKGRVFYTAFGHREDVWESEPYRQHLLGAIRWAFGLTGRATTQ